MYNDLYIYNNIRIIIYIYADMNQFDMGQIGNMAQNMGQNMGQQMGQMGFGNYG